MCVSQRGRVSVVDVERSSRDRERKEADIRGIVYMST